MAEHDETPADRPPRPTRSGARSAPAILWAGLEARGVRQPDLRPHRASLQYDRSAAAQWRALVSEVLPASRGALPWNDRARRRDRDRGRRARRSTTRRADWVGDRDRSEPEHDRAGARALHRPD